MTLPSGADLVVLLQRRRGAYPWLACPNRSCYRNSSRVEARPRCSTTSNHKRKNSSQQNSLSSITWTARPEFVRFVSVRHSSRPPDQVSSHHNDTHTFPKSPSNYLNLHPSARPRPSNSFFLSDYAPTHSLSFTHTQTTDTFLNSPSLFRILRVRLKSISRRVVSCAPQTFNFAAWYAPISRMWPSQGWTKRLKYCE